MNKNFNYLIDNSDKDFSVFLEYADRNFETIDECIENLLKLASDQKLINFALISFHNEWIFTIYFDEKNNVKEVSPNSHFFFGVESLFSTLKNSYRHKISADGVEVRTMQGLLGGVK